MKSFLLIALACAVSATARASSPLELSITKIALPKLTLTIKNTDALRNVRLWERGMSWGDYTLHFEFLDRTGIPAGKSAYKPRSYKRNFALAYELKPGETRTFDFDLVTLWTQPQGIDLKHSEGVSVRAVINQHLEVEAHRKSVFTGEVKSPWTDMTKPHGEASCVEWNALPAHRDGALFDSVAFLDSLGKLRISQADDKASLLECLGSNLPWNQVGFICYFKDEIREPLETATLLLPGAMTVTFCWDNQKSLSTAERLQLSKNLKLSKFGDGAEAQPRWALATDVLPSLPARGITKIFVNNANGFWEEWERQGDGSYGKKGG
ncbi:MAG: hypothetical protein K9N47_17445 [Prosthecobacter sp.]|uniref:hypothetical protein n=1 Tax=Prosthecobacter sp. TaxID=1965333 RepID=UPI0025E6BC61|nr:hypothetical protein [Prosthecobacter sp.]MCF7787909.1 hypothetical protein [Prosthecobacter sp.]